MASCECFTHHQIIKSPNHQIFHNFVFMCFAKKILLTACMLASSVSMLQAQSTVVMGIDTTQSLGNFDYVFGMTTLPGGNIWISGRGERTLNSSGGQVINYGNLVQLTPSGNIVTSQKSGYRSMNALTSTYDNNLVVGGEGSGFMCTSGMCKSDMLIAKLTPAYTLLWGRSFGNPNYNGSDGLKRVKETADSNIVIVGNIYESSNNSHPFIAKLNGNTGDTIWTRAMGWPSNQFGSDASECPNGDLYLGVSGDLRIFKLDAAGTLLWSKGFATYGDVKRVFAQPDGSVIGTGNYLVPGTGDYSACIFKVSATGTLEWFHNYNSPTPDINVFLNDVVFSNGNFYLGGYQYSMTNFTGFIPLLIKTDSLGTVAWALTHTSPVGEIKSLLAYSASIICGIDYSPGVVNNRPDILLTPVDTSGNTSNNCFIPFTLVMGTPSITVSNISSWFYTDFETQNTPISFSYQNYWHAPECLTSGIEQIQSESPFTLIQQNGELSISPVSSSNYSIEIFDVTGRRLFHREKSSGTQTVSVDRFASQLLWVRIQQNERSFSKKIFVE